MNRNTYHSTFKSNSFLFQELQNGLKKIGFTGPTLHVVDAGEKLHLTTHRGPDALAKSLETPVTSSAI